MKALFLITNCSTHIDTRGFLYIYKQIELKLLIDFKLDNENVHQRGLSLHKV